MQYVKLISAEDKLVIALYGEIDSAVSDDFYAQVSAIYNHDKKDIVFDCSALTFIENIQAFKAGRAHLLAQKCAAAHKKALPDMRA